MHEGLLQLLLVVSMQQLRSVSMQQSQVVSMLQPACDQGF
jgi:hypothetical protein